MNSKLEEKINTLFNNKYEHEFRPNPNKVIKHNKTKSKLKFGNAGINRLTNKI